MDEDRERSSRLMLLDEGRSPHPIARRAVRCWVGREGAAGAGRDRLAWKASAVAWRMSPAPRRVKSVAGGRDVEADGCGHDEDGGAEFCD